MRIRHSNAPFSASLRIACAAYAVALLTFASAQEAEEPTVPPARQAPPPQATRAQPRPPQTSDLRQRLGRARLARTPELFGDQFFSQPVSIRGSLAGGSPFFEFGELHVPGYLRGYAQKIAENNHPLPRDRFFYNFNAFQDALRFDSSFDGFFARSTSSQSLYRHTLGVEKTFFDGQSSLELRMPFDTNNDFRRTVAPDVFAYEGGTAGNLVITGKVLLYSDEEFVVSGGLGIEAPTGSDSSAAVNTTVVQFENSTVYFSPFVGGIWLPNEDWFVSSYAQLQLAAGGNPVLVDDLLLPSATRIGTLTPPAGGMIDIAVGRWLYRDRPYMLVNSMALIAEIHHFSAFQDGDSIGPFNSGVTTVQIDSGERFSLTSLTLGVHNEIFDNCSLRIGGVIPLSDAAFDSELIIQLNVLY